jgi:hypothetical protein
MRHTASICQFAEMPTDRVRSSPRDRMQLQHQGQIKTGHVSSMHPVDGGIEYVVRTDLVDGCMGAAINVWATSGRPTSLAPLWPAPEGGLLR